MENNESVARDNRIDGVPDVAKMSSDGSSTQINGVTELRNPLDQFEISWLIKDWSSLTQTVDKLEFPDFTGGPNHLWSIGLRWNKEDESVVIHLELKMIGGSSDFIEISFLHTIIAEDESLSKDRLDVYYKTKVGDSYDLGWEVEPCFFDDDTFRIQLIVRVKNSFKPDLVKHTMMTSQSRTSLMIPKLSRALTSLSKAFESLFQSKEFADFEVVVGDVKIPAHKNILAARSAVFAAMLANEMTEDAEGKVVIDDFEPEVVNAMLEYLYTGKTEVKGVSTEDLMLIADKYQLPDLVEECETVLISELTMPNAARFLKLAQMVASVPDLKNRSIEFIKGNIEEVSKTQGYQELVKSSPELLTEILLWKN